MEKTALTGQPNFSTNVSTTVRPLIIFVVAIIKSYAIPSWKAIQIKNLDDES